MKSRTLSFSMLIGTNSPCQWGLHFQKFSYCSLVTSHCSSKNPFKFLSSQMRFSWVTQKDGVPAQILLICECLVYLYHHLSFISKDRFTGYRILVRYFFSIWFSVPWMYHPIISFKVLADKSVKTHVCPASLFLLSKHLLFSFNGLAVSHDFIIWLFFVRDLSFKDLVIHFSHSEIILFFK